MKSLPIAPAPPGAQACCAVSPAPKLRHLDRLTAFYAALSDPIRLRILALLTEGEICVCHIHGSLGVPQPTASRHLAYLRRAGLVTARRDGIWMHYRLVRPDDVVLGEILGTALHALTHAEQTDRDQVKLQRELATSR